MNKLINLIGGVVLCGILIKLSYVFVYLFDQLDNGGVVARVTGVTFAFASIYFVVKVGVSGKHSLGYKGNLLLHRLHQPTGR